MTAEADDPFRERLSPYLDGELEDDDARALEAHLADCAACRRELGELRRLVTAARGLPERAPGTDLWPAIERALEERTERAAPAATGRDPKRWTWLVAGLAAGFLLAVLFFRGTRDGQGDEATELAAGEHYLLLLHESPDSLAGASPEEVAAVVGEYTRWAQELGRAGKLVDGAKLADGEGRWLRPAAAPGRFDVADRPERGGVGGYFVVRAGGYDEAMEITRSCPHLAYGGWIELRRIEET